jgi:putative addiction module killer protein
MRVQANTACTLVTYTLLLRASKSILWDKSVNVQEYIKKDETSPYRTWFNSLDAQAAAKVSVAKVKMELGNTSGIKWFRGIGEYVIDWGPGYRIYLAQDGKDLIVLFGGSTKKGQQKAIDTAIELFEEYKQRKKGIKK